MRLEIQELRQRLESGKREAARLQEVAQGHASRVQAAPALESQLTELMRDYNTLAGGLHDAAAGRARSPRSP